MGEKKNEKKEEEKKWPPAHEVLTVLLGDITCIQTISKAYAKGMAAPPEGIPGLINVLESAKLTTTGRVGFIRKDIEKSIRNLKKQLTEAKAKEQKGEPPVVSIVMEMSKRVHRISKHL